MSGSRHGPRGGGGTRGAVRAWLAWWVLLTALYVVLVDTRRVQELVAAVVIGAFGAAAAVLVRQEREVVLRPRARWIAHELRTALDWPRDLALLAAALVRRPRGRIVETPFDASEHGPRGAARGALAVGGRSLAPNRIVIDIDAERRVLAYHELVEREDDT
jgi:hypothetical protein